VSRAELLQAYRPPNPHLEAVVRFGPEGNTALELHAMQQLTDVILMPLSVGAANALTEAARLTAAEQLLSEIFAVKRAYYELQASLAVLNLERQSQEAASVAAVAAQQLFDAGNIRDVVLASEQARRAEAQLELMRAEMDATLKHQALAELLGLWQADSAWSVPGVLPAPVADELPPDFEREALLGSLNLAIIRKRYEAAARTANLSTARGWLPDVGAGVSAEHDDAGWGLGPALSVGLPLFDQGQAASALYETEARRQQLLLAQTAARVRSSARSGALRQRTAKTGAQQLQEEVLPLRQKLVAATQREYNAMLVGVFQLLATKRDELEANKALVWQLRDYWLAQLSIEQLRAGSLPAGSTLEPAQAAVSETSSASTESH
jgi:cobalt-zinc-cadmium efflux system outer membrane protein